MPPDTTNVEYFPIPAFKFHSCLTKDIQIAYRTFPPSTATSRGTVLIPTCYGGHINDTLNFKTGCLRDYTVIVVAMLGNGESSSPSNDPSFPSDYSLRYQDCINSQYALLTQKFKLEKLDAVIGFSMGGQQAYYWAVMHGSGPSPFVKNAVVICGSAKTSGHNYAFLEGPVAALTTSHDYAKGEYKENGVVPKEGLAAFGRAYAAWLTSPEWFRQELWRKMGAGSLKDWLFPPNGESSFEGWDAEDLLTLARMWQAGDVGSVGADDDYKKALEGVEAKVLVMPSKSDQYFPPEDGEEEVKYLKNGVFDPIPTIWGHIAGGGANEDDTTWMNESIGRFLADGR